MLFSSLSPVLLISLPFSFSVILLVFTLACLPFLSVSEYSWSLCGLKYSVKKRCVDKTVWAARGASMKDKKELLSESGVN